MKLKNRPYSPISSTNLFLKLILLSLVFLLVHHPEVLAQGQLEGRINQVILSLIRILNVVIVGFIAWAGFLIAKGDGSGMKRLIYAIIGLVTVNSAFIIINYFS